MTVIWTEESGESRHIARSYSVTEMTAFTQALELA